MLRHQASGVTGSNPTRQHPEMSPVLQAGGHLYVYPVTLRREGRQCWIFHWGAPLLLTVHETPQVAWCPQSPPSEMGTDPGHRQSPSPSVLGTASETGGSFMLGPRESAQNPDREGRGPQESPVAPRARACHPGTPKPRWGEAVPRVIV